MTVKSPSVTNYPLVCPGRRRSYNSANNSDVGVDQNPRRNPRPEDQQVTVVTDLGLSPGPFELFEWTVNSVELAPGSGGDVLDIGDFAVLQAKQYFEGVLDITAGSYVIGIILNITDIPAGINNITYISEGSGVLGVTGFEGASSLTTTLTCLTPDITGNVFDILGRPIGFVDNATTLSFTLFVGGVFPTGLTGQVFAGYGFNFLERDYDFVDNPIQRQFTAAVSQIYVDYAVEKVVAVYNITTPTLTWGTQGEYIIATSDTDWNMGYAIPFQQNIIACSCVFEFDRGSQQTVIASSIAAVIPEEGPVEDTIDTLQFETKAEMIDFVTDITTGGSFIDRGGQYGIANTVSFTGVVTGVQIRDGVPCPLCPSPVIFGVEYYVIDSACGESNDVNVPGTLDNLRFFSQIPTLNYNNFVSTAPAPVGNQIKRTLYYSAAKLSGMNKTATLNSADVFGISVARCDPFVEVSTTGSNLDSTIIGGIAGCQYGNFNFPEVFQINSSAINNQTVGPHTYTPNTAPLLYQIEYYSQAYIDQVGIPPVNDGNAPPEVVPAPPDERYTEIYITIDSTEYVESLGYTQETFEALPYEERQEILAANQPERLVVPLESVQLADGQTFESSMTNITPNMAVRTYGPSYNVDQILAGAPQGQPAPPTLLQRALEFYGDYGPLINGVVTIATGGTVNAALAGVISSYIKGEIKNVAFDTAETAYNEFRFRDTGMPALPTDPRSLTYQYFQGRLD